MKYEASTYVSLADGWLMILLAEKVKKENFGFVSYIVSFS